MRKFALLLTMAIGMLALAACGNNGGNDTGAASPSNSAPASQEASETVTPTGNVVEVTINGSNFEFDAKEIKANLGDTVRVTYNNAEGAHAVKFKNFDTEVKNGETKEFVVTEKGEFSFSCSIMCGAGHDKMTGKLIVS